MTPRNPLTRRSAAGALDGTTPSGSARLDQVLAAATAPATEAELGREDVALTMFQQGPSARARRASGVGLRARFASARIVTAGVVVALLAGSGVAIAAGVGPGDGIFRSPADKSGPRAPVDPSARPTALPSQAQDGGQTVRSYAGLCRAFQAEALTNGNVAANPEYAALAEDAGGQGAIKQYCQELLGAKPTPGGKPSALPTPGGKPSGLPTQAADPTKPAVPTPTARPTDPPAPTPSPSPTRTHPGGGKPTKPPKP